MLRAAFLTTLVFSASSAMAQSMHASELPESAYTAGKGKTNLHLDGYQSAYGLTDNVDIGTRILPSYFGMNLQSKIAVIQDDAHALSIEPLMWAEWPWAKLGSPSYTVGAMARYSRTLGKGRLNLGLGLKYDVLKVTLKKNQGDEFVEDKGVEVTHEFSLTLLRAPFVFHEDVTKTRDGWDFQGIRMPVILGYELPVTDRSVVHTALRVHPLNIANGGSWAVEVHPSWSMAVSDTFRFGLGANILAPGMPFPVADDGLAAEIEAEEGTSDYAEIMEKIPQTGGPVFVLPTIGLWWRL